MSSGQKPYLKILLVNLCIAVVCVFFAWALSCVFGKGLVKYTDNADKLFYLSRYYNTVNNDFTGYRAMDEIVIINCHEKGDVPISYRDTIAAVIDRVAQFSPKVIGVDILFKGRRTEQEDKHLQEAVARNRDLLVFARSKYETENHSFFDTDSANLRFGYTNLGDYYGAASSKSPSFDATILSVAGVLDTEFEAKHSIIDFTSKGLDPIDADKFLKMGDDAQKLVNDKIVLLGDKDDEKDVINPPFLMNGQEWMPGVYYHAYCINSMREGGPKFREDNLLGFIASLLLVFVYSLLSGMAAEFLESKRDILSGHKYRTYLFLKPVAMTLFWAMVPFLLVWICSCYLRIVPNLVLAMLSVSIIMFFENYFNELKKSLL